MSISADNEKLNCLADCEKYLTEVHEATKTHIYISPHLDDAVFSCGGRIWQQKQSGATVLVVTVFGGVPASDVPLSPFAQSLHQRWGNPTNAARQRQEEDRAALAVLGAEPIHWPYLDCIYRRLPNGDFAYANEEALWGEIHPSESDLLQELVARLTQLLCVNPEGLLYGPLGVGHHVDHLLVRRALTLSGLTVRWYEDFPYAEKPSALRNAFDTELQWQPEVVLLSEEALAAKIAAIACYHSQMSTFWSNLAEMAERVRHFATEVGGGHPAERYWRTT